MLTKAVEVAPKIILIMRTVGAGSKYPVAIADADGDYLNGAKHYKLHLPTDIPAKAFWAVTAYNVTDCIMPKAGTMGYTLFGFSQDQGSDRHQSMFANKRGRTLKLPYCHP